jgi:murein DD-endopeptidase MepM/ murein hydrolase activator NlpD
MKKRWISIGLILFIVLSNMPIVRADDLDKKQDQLKGIQQTIKSLQGQIKNVNGQKKSIYSQIATLDKQMNTVQGEINNLDNKIDDTNEYIKNTSEELEKAIEELGEYKDLYADRIRAIYMNGPSGYLEILFSSSSFSDFISRMEVVKKIMEYDSNILVEMKDRQESIEDKKASLESKKSQLVSLYQQASSKKQQLNEASKQKKQYYSKLNGDLKELERALNAEVAESKELETEIRAIMAKRNSNLVYSGKRYNIVKNSEAGRTIRVTSQFGNRYHPVLKRYKLHTGLDLGVPTGTPVHAMADGEVIIAKYSSAYGNYIVIDHGSGISTLYAHNSKLLVHVGQKIEGGEIISKSGNTGYSTGPHLHFEVRKNGTPIDPAPYLIIGQ